MKFSIKRVQAVFKIRNREFYRDIGALGWVIIFPLIMVLTFGHIFDVDKGENYKIGYWGEVDTLVIENIEWVSYASKKEALEKLRYQKLDAVITIDQKPPIIWSAKGSARSKMVKKLLHLHFVSNDQKPFYEEEVEGKVMSYLDWVFPGIVNLNVMFMGLWGVGWVIVRQRKLGILKRFKASPLTAFEYLLAQMISRLVVMVISCCCVYLLASLIYPFKFEGNIFSLLTVFSFGCLALSSIGFIFAARISSEELCNGLLNFVTYPLMFISEIWFSLEGSPEWVHRLAWFSPLWQMTDSMRKILYENYTLYQVKESVIFLGVFGLVFTLIGASLFKWTKD